VTTNFVAGNQVQEGIFPVASGVARYYGAVPLKPADATNYGVGFILRPFTGTSLTVDLDVSYTIAEKYTVTIGAQNLFSTYPDKIAQSSTINVFPISGGLADGQVYPRSGGLFGMNGGFGYVSLKANF
jgi:outer membrane receptor protein involved in Fe transport